MPTVLVKIDMSVMNSVVGDGAMTLVQEVGPTRS